MLGMLMLRMLPFFTPTLVVSSTLLFARHPYLVFPYRVAPPPKLKVCMYMHQRDDKFVNLTISLQEEIMIVISLQMEDSDVQKDRTTKKGKKGTGNQQTTQLV